MQRKDEGKQRKPAPAVLGVGGGGCPGRADVQRTDVAVCR
jgi:hypothetical protein